MEQRDKNMNESQLRSFLGNSVKYIICILIWLVIFSEFRKGHKPPWGILLFAICITLIVILSAYLRRRLKYFGE